MTDQSFLASACNSLARSWRARRQVALVAVLALVAAGLADIAWSAPAQAAGGSPCGANINPIACENSQTSGVVPQSAWDTDFGDAGAADIQGFTTDISVNAGSPISFKIKTTLAYTIDIYRLGYYGGNGARLWQGNLAHNAPVNQPTCLSDPSTLLYDCGNWSVSATWNVPAAAVSGVFIARLTASNGDNSQIPFVVRNDASTSDIVYQTSDPTWEAYNTYGGSDYYTGTTSLTGTQARAFKISYNRPFTTRSSDAGRSFLFSNEYPAIRFLERNGYDVSYVAGVDTDRLGASQIEKHKTFLSVGHDEYWSQGQRSNVEAARDAGVNLMFLSGNEIYWHTRYESSIDSSHTAYRTLVDYKETWDNAKIDPTPEWTGTWRDPRFADAPGGANPENALTGTLFMANSADLPVTVTAAEGKTRLWRGTTLSSMQGASTALAPHTVGYESDEDIDNGFRPAGLVDLSTTVGPSPEELTDFGNTEVASTTTHHVTLYRAGSGALVFSAGTVQWAWGLDQDHDGDNSSPADPRMQQATANMLADMHALPTTLMSGLVMPTASTDTQPPSVTITSPAAGTIANGTQVTVTGSATDAGGGQVAGVEVSVDGGATWHPATGTTSWSYTGILQGDSGSAIKARASDDSANVSAPVTLGVTAACPCSLFGNQVLAMPDAGDTTGAELGVYVKSTEDGYISGIRFYKSAQNTGTHTGTLWTASGDELATGTFTGESGSGWQTLVFATPVAVTAGTTYVASYWAPKGHESAATNFFYYSDYSAPPLKALRTAPDGSTVNGVYATSDAFPTNTYHANNYYVDVLFQPAATAPLQVTAVSPTAGASSVATSTTLTATFSKPIDTTSLAFTMTDSGARPVPGTVAYNPTTRTATLTPSAALAAGSSYSATVTATASDGTKLAAPMTWTFQTATAAQSGGGCPCTLYSDSTVPTTVTEDDPSSVELGVKFTADTDGVITGVRFYKGPQNTGTHTGSLWTVDGTLLATAVFANESSTGWQTVTFTNPVPVTAGTTYVASYHTSVGYYSATTGAYGSSGYDKFPLHVPVNGAVYGFTTGFPTNAWSASYGVDVTFTVPSSVVPGVSASTPANGATNVAIDSPITATLSTSTLPDPTVTVKAADGSSVDGHTTIDATRRVVTFAPTAALAAATTYTVSLTGAQSLSGTAQSGAATWTFSTVGSGGSGGGGSGGSGSGGCCTLFAPDSVPSTPDSGDGSAVTLGVQIVPSTSGYITGVRFYKSAANTGTHTGSLWDSSGTRLATVTFANETASGWQQALFSQPVAVTASATYVVSYYAPNGHYSYTGWFFSADYVNGVLTAPGGINGVYHYSSDAFPTDTYSAANYWVDAVFSTTAGSGGGSGTDSTPPSAKSVSPIDAATSVSTAVTPSVTFDEAVTAGSIAMTLKAADGTAVTGSVSYDATSKTATFSPGAALTRGTKYTVTASATDTAGNAMPAPYAWSFTAAQPSPPPGSCPCSVWDDATTPATITEPDSNATELGVKFSASVNGQVLGVRFYKGPTNTGSHTGSLWSATGQLLATGTFTGESSTGWQTLTFASPVSVVAATTYVVSYHSQTGGYSATEGQFAATGVDNAPLHIAAHAGVSIQGNSAFPTTTTDNNYWVDPVFTNVVADTTPPTITGVAASASGSTLTVTWNTDENSTSRVAYGTSAGSLTGAATTGGSVTAHSVPITGVTANTRYYFRVTSADAAGNAATSPDPQGAPATWAPTTAPLLDSTVADFSAGQTSSSYVATNGDGEVVLLPSTVAEFAGTTLPSGWTASVGTGGSAKVASGSVTLTNSTLTTSASYRSGRSLVTLATLGKNQSIGWVSTSTSSARYTLTVNSSNQLVATVDDGLITNTSSVIATGWTAAPHTFRIDWNSGSATFYLDGVQKYTHSIFAAYPTWRPTFSDTVATDGGLAVDWVRVAPYAASGSFSSRVLDAGAPVSWDGLTWDATVPTGTTLVVNVRSGNTATPDGTWSAYARIPTSGGSVGKTSRYLQYQLVFTSTGTDYETPTVRSVGVAFHV